MNTNLSDIGSPTLETAVAVTETAQLITVLGPKKTMEVYNADPSNLVFYGDLNVTSANGIPILPGETKTWASVENGFKIYFVCAAGKTATLRRITYRGR